MPLDGPRAEEQLRTDLVVRPPVAREARDLDLLGRELVDRLGCPPADRLPGRDELAPRPLGEGVHADLCEEVVGRPELLARIDPPALPAQPLPVEQARPGTFRTQARPIQEVDRVAVELVGGRPVRHQSPPARLEAQPPGRVDLPDVLAQSIQTLDRALLVPRPRGRLDQLAERPHRHEQLRRVVARLDRRGQRFFVAAEPVHDDGVGPVGVLDRGPLAARGGVPDGRGDQVGRLELASAKPREDERTVGTDPRAGGIPDRIRLGDEQGGPAEVAGQADRLAEHVDAHREDLERPELRASSTPRVATVRHVSRSHR